LLTSECHNLDVSAPESTWPAQWLRGALELCVLALVAERDTYGYAIAQRLEAANFGRIKGGTLYPILLRLEEDGLVTSTWQAGEAGPGRKFFQITTQGRKELQSRRASWIAFTTATDKLLSGAATGADEGES
jgi:PadR family transcriptional regulator, regulatory protein PadR